MHLMLQTSLPNLTPIPAYQLLLPCPPPFLISFIIMKARFLKVNLKRWRKMGSRVFPWAEKFSEWDLPWPSMRQEAKSIPRDVPKGHVAVYVGENCKRFVIKIALLKHPQFRALLDQAQDVYDFIADSKLCIPCDEHIFISMVRCCANA